MKYTEWQSITFAKGLDGQKEAAQSLGYEIVELEGNYPHRVFNILDKDKKPVASGRVCQWLLDKEPNHSVAYFPTGAMIYK